MIRVAALAAALAAALVAGSEAPAKVEGRVFGLLGNANGHFVVELEPGTLQPLPGRRLRVGPKIGARWALDPSRHTLAIADGNLLRLVDLATMRPAGRVKIGWELEPSGAVWFSPGRILVFRRTFGRCQVAVVDIARRRIVSRRELGDVSIVRSDRTQNEVVILRAPTSEIGPASLLLVDAAGAVREIALPRIRAGLHMDEDLTPPVATANRPALALDKEKRIAYVVAADGLVAEASLDGGDVRYHAVHGRFAKLVSGSYRHALFLNGKLVVTGTNSTVLTGRDGKPELRTDPAGLDVIDPGTWEVRRLADGVSSVVSWPGGLLATGGSSTAEVRNNGGIGLAVYGHDGGERFRMLDGKLVWVLAVYGGRAFVQAVNEEPVLIVDLASGRVIGTRRGNMPWLLLEQNAPVW